MGDSQPSNNYSLDFADICNEDYTFWDFPMSDGKQKDIARKEKFSISDCNDDKDSEASCEEPDKRNFQDKTLTTQTNENQLRDTRSIRLETDALEKRNQDESDFMKLSTKENYFESTEDNDDGFWDFLKPETSNEDEKPSHKSLSEELEELSRLSSVPSCSQLPNSSSVVTSSLKNSVAKDFKTDKDLQNQLKISDNAYRDLELLSSEYSSSPKRHEKKVKAYQNISFPDQKLAATSTQKKNSKPFRESSCLTEKSNEHDIKIKTQNIQAKILPSCTARPLRFSEQKFNIANKNQSYFQDCSKNSVIGYKIVADNITPIKQPIHAFPKVVFNSPYFKMEEILSKSNLKKMNSDERTFTQTTPLSISSGSSFKQPISVFPQMVFESPCMKVEEILTKSNLNKMSSNVSTFTQTTPLSTSTGFQTQYQNIQEQLNPDTTSGKEEKNINLNIPVISSIFSVSPDTYDKSKFTSNMCRDIQANGLSTDNLEQNYKTTINNVVTSQGGTLINANLSAVSNSVNSGSLSASASNYESPSKQKNAKRMLKESPENSVFKITDSVVDSGNQNNGEDETLEEELTNKRQKISELAKNVTVIDKKNSESDNKTYPPKSFTVNITNTEPFYSIIQKSSQPDQNQNTDLVMILNNENAVTSNCYIKTAPISSNYYTTPFSAAPVSTVMNTNMPNSVYQTSSNILHPISFPSFNVVNAVENTDLPEKFSNLKHNSVSGSVLQINNESTVKPQVPVSTAHMVRKVNIIPSHTLQNPVQSNVILYSISTAPSNITCPSASQINAHTISVLPSNIQIHNANSEGNKQSSQQIPGYFTLNTVQLNPTRQPISTGLFPVQKIKVAKQPKLRPIKNIPLGKDKKAIQQIKIPVKVADTTNFAMKSGNNDFTVSEHPYYQSLKICPKSVSEVIEKVPNAQHATVSIGASQPNKVLNFMPYIRNTKSMQLKKSSVSNETEITNKEQFVKDQASTPLNLRYEICTSLSNQNTISNKVQVGSTNPLSTNFYTGSATENNSMGLGKGNINTSEIQGSEFQKNTLANLKELFPPPISMIPVCVMQTVQTMSNPAVTKVVVLQNSRSNNSEVRLSSSLNQLRPPNKKTVTVKAKKLGRKTVRELLQEKYQHTPKPQVTTKLLKPIYRLTRDGILIPTDKPVVPEKSLVVNCSTKFPINKVNNVTNSIKRPNIMVLPSTTKLSQNNNFLEDISKKKLKQDSTDEGSKLDSCSSEIFKMPCDFLFDKISCKDYKPRYYDMCELRIGYFKVEDDVDSCGKFRSKFKVLFTKNLFTYDFPVMKCNQVDLNCFSWERMVRIQVPFKTVVAINMNNRHISIQVNRCPQVCVKNIKERNDLMSGEKKQNNTVNENLNCLTSIKSSSIHRIILRKRQADNLKTHLCQFDPKFLVLFSIGANSKSLSLDATPFEEDILSVNLKKMWAKNKRNVIRRLPQWDCENVVEPFEIMDSDHLVSSNHVCSCRISCRSLRCSCVKAAKSCSTGGAVCLCTNCDNPLNILESFGMNVDFLLSDSCLFQNIYQIPKLRNYLQKEIKLNCCNSVARVLDCIPGTILCPNTECNASLEFSWCRGIVCYPERNPRNHCSYCGQCCFSNGRHCPVCNRCYIVTAKCLECPLCRENGFEIKAFDDEDFDFLDDEFTEASLLEPSLTKPFSKPEIVVLDGVHSKQKTKIQSPGNGTLSNESDETYHDQKFIGESFQPEDIKTESQCAMKIENFDEMKGKSEKATGDCDPKQCGDSSDTLDSKENIKINEENLKSETCEENTNIDLEILLEKDSLSASDDKLLLKSYLTQFEGRCKTAVALEGEIELIDT